MLYKKEATESFKQKMRRLPTDLQSAESSLEETTALSRRKGTIVTRMIRPISQILGVFFKNIKRVPVALALLLVVLGVSYGAVTIFGGSTAEEITQAEQEAAQKEIAEVLEQTGRLFVLPQGETPIMATVVDAEALRAEQPFYSNIIDGDKVLVYIQNQQAIIYSPTRNIIVNVGPVQFQQGVSQEADTELGQNIPSSTSKDTAKQIAIANMDGRFLVEVRNGSGVTGAAARLESELTALSSDYAVMGITDAVRNDYQETIIVNLTGEGGTEAISNLATLLGAVVVTSLPEKESATQAEVLIIIGAQ